MITLEKRTDAIDALNKQSSLETWDGWLTDRMQHNTFIAHFGLPIAIDYEEIEGKTDHEIRQLIKARIISALKDALNERT